MAGFATDKVHPHGYLPDYLRIAAELGPAASVLEVGVQHGWSLTLWMHLFPDSPVIAGVDHEENATWPEGTVRVVGDQADPNLPGLVSVHSPRL